MEDWGPCSADCGEGIRERRVQCKIFLEFSKTVATLPDRKCPGPKPPMTEICFAGLCDGGLPPKKNGDKDKKKKAEDKDDEDGVGVPKIPGAGELIGDRFVRMWWLYRVERVRVLLSNLKIRCYGTARKRPTRIYL